MKKHLCIISFVLLLSAMLASAAPINILLNSPADKATIKEYTQDFIFSFDQDPTDIILNCSLIVNNEVKGFRNSLIMRNNNKISLDLGNGDYTWHISCLDNSLNVIDSDIRTFTVNTGSIVKEGYEIFYNTNGLRSYILTIAPGQKQVTLPAMKSGEDIDIVIGPKTYYLDILSIGVKINQTFVGLRDRSASKRYDMAVSSTQGFDFDNDKTIDVELLLKNVERGVNAYFVVTPYPATTPAAPAETTPGENPTQPAETTSETPVTQPQEQPAEQAQGNQAQEEPSGQEIISEQENNEPKSNWLIPIILVIVLAIVLAITLINSKAKKSEKRAAKKEMPEQEQQPAQQEKFDIIKSTGKKR